MTLHPGEGERVHVERHGARGRGGFGLSGNAAEPGTVMAGGRRGWASMEAATIAAKPVIAPPQHPQTRAGGPVPGLPSGVIGAGAVTHGGAPAPAMGLYNPAVVGGAGAQQQRWGAAGTSVGGRFGASPHHAAHAGVGSGGAVTDTLGVHQQQAMLYGRGRGEAGPQQWQGAGGGAGYL